MSELSLWYHYDSADLEYYQRRIEQFHILPKSISLKESQPNQYLDIGIAALWSKEDQPLTDKLFAEIRAHRINPNAFDEQLLRCLNDQTAHYDFDDTKKFEPLEVTQPKKDLVVYVGQQFISQLVCGKLQGSMNSYASGTGTAIERPQDVRLSAENARVSMTTDGFAEPTGTAMKFAGRFSTTVASGIISEGGVFNSLPINSGVMLFRTVYPSGSFIEHQQNTTYYSLTQTVSQLSVT